MAESDKTKYKEVSSRVDSDELEREVLDYWEKEKVFEKSLSATKDGPVFTFYDGPPYATGKPHYGHVLQSSIKDTVLRYKTMQGFHVPRRVGWDCHGLPVEVLVEKELGLKTKQDIEKLGIEEFNSRCREVVFRYIDEFTGVLKRLGRWAEYENAYATLDLDYMESEWWVFKNIWEQNLVYKAFRSTPFCIRCSTPLSNFEVSSNYKTVKDVAVYVLLPVVGQDLFLLVWTTTPWTLSANVAVAISQDLSYVTVVKDGKNIVVAKDLVDKIFGAGTEVLTTWTIEELQKLHYKPLYDVPITEEEFGDKAKNTFLIITSDHVTGDDGSGLVHIAPAFGEDDALLAEKYNLPVLRTVDTHGRFLPLVPKWSGRKIFDANKEIVGELEAEKLLLRQEEYEHSYPFCWRCDTPLIYYALDTWFIKIADLKERMLAINEKEINWTPKHVKSGRFAKGIEAAPDWAVSRNRFWSVPLPIWECDNCEERICIGSVRELKEISGEKNIEDIHRPYVDEIKWNCLKCDKGSMTRVPEVLDVWFDSASMPYSQWHYPFENKDFVEDSYPADFIVEAIEMTRAWFYVMHVLASALTKEDIGLGKDNPAFKNVIASGLIFAEDGQKLSKKLKNYPEIEPTIEKYGADVLRFYLLTSSSLGEPYKFSEKEMQQLQRNTYSTLWNVYSFFVRYANVHAFKSVEDVGGSVLDKWIVARVKKLQEEVISSADEYQVDQAARAFIPFIDDLSNWYVRRSRQRFQPATAESSQDTQAALSTLHYVLVNTARLLAAFMPFVAEEIYRNLTGDDSVHLQSLPDHADAHDDVTDEDKDLLAQMDRARSIVSQGLALRAAEKIKVRQPLSEVVALGDELDSELVEQIRDEINVKKVSFGELNEGDGWVVTGENEKVRVALNISISDDLRQEGMAREIIRHGQLLRRKAGYALDDRIDLVVADAGELMDTISKFNDEIAKALQADAVVEAGEADEMELVKIGEAEINLGVRKK